MFINKNKGINYNNNTKNSDQPLINKCKQIVTTHIKKKYNKTGNSIYNKEIIQYVELNACLFICIFIFIIIGDIILLLEFTLVMNFFEYYVNNLIFGNYYSAIIGYIHLHFILNTTEESLILAIKEDINNNELINTYIKRTYDYYHLLKNNQAKSSSRYPLLENYFIYECNEVIKTINESFFQVASQVFQKNYTILPVFICEHFELLQLRNFEQVDRELLTRMRKIFIEGRGLRTYDNLVSFSRSKDIIDIYLILLIFNRPIKKYYGIIVNLPLMSKQFENYIALVIGLFILNSLLEVVICSVIKWVLINRLVKIQDELLLFKNCFN